MAAADSCQALLDAITTARDVIGAGASPRRLQEETKVAASVAAEPEDSTKVHDLLSELERTRKASRRRIGGLQQELSQSRTHHAEQAAAIERLERELSAAKSRAETLDKDLEQERGSAKECKAALQEYLERDVAQELDISRGEVATLRGKLHDAEVRASTADVKVAELQSLVYASSGDDRLAILRQQVHELSAENVSRDKLLAAKEALLTDLRTRLQTETEAKFRLTADIDQLRHQLDEEQREVSNLSMTVSMKDGALTDARSQAREAHIMYNDSVAERDQIEAQAHIREEALKQLVAEVQRDAESVREELHARDAIVLRVQRENSALSAECEEARVERTMAQQSRIDARNLLSQQLQQSSLTGRARVAYQAWVAHAVSTRQQRLENERDTLQVQLADSVLKRDEENAAALATKHELEGQLTVLAQKARAREEDLESEIDVLLRRVKELEGQASVATSSANARVKSLAEELEVLRDALEDARDSRDREQRDGRSTSEKYKGELQRVNAAFEKERDTFRAALERSEADASKHREEHLATRRSLAEAQRTIASLQNEVEALTELCRGRDDETRSVASSSATGGAADARTAEVVLLETRLANAERELAVARDEAFRAAAERPVATATAVSHEAQELAQREIAAVKAELEKAQAELVAMRSVERDETKELRRELEHVTERRRVEAAVLKDLIAGLESSHVDEVRGLLTSARQQQHEAAEIAAAESFAAATSFAAQQRPDRVFANGSTVLMRATRQRLAARFFSRWIVFASRRGLQRSRNAGKENAARMAQSVEQATAVAQASMEENKSLIAKYHALQSEYATAKEELANATPNAQQQEEVERVRAQLTDLHGKARMSNEIMATAKAQINTMSRELKATRERESILSRRVKELSTSLDREATETRRLKDEFISFLAGSPANDASPGVHTHTRGSVPRRS